MKPAPVPPRPDDRVELRLPLSTLIKVVLFAASLVSLWVLRPFIAVFALSALCAVTLLPLTQKLQKRGVSHGVAVLIVGGGLLAVIAGFWALVLPPLVGQVGDFVSHFDQVRQSLDQKTQHTPVLHRAFEQAMQWPQSAEAKELFRQKWTWGLALFDSLAGVVLLLILTIYLLLDGKGLYAWMLGYVPRRHRNRVAATMPEVSAVLRAYVRGNAITSVICSVYAWGVLSLLHVPAALPLAILAGILDILPVLGFVLAVVPAALIGLSRSPATALGVVGFYVLYHLIENYILLPKIYGKQLRLSTLTVLVAIIVGGTLGGVIGAVLILPIVAAYPIIERFWLGGYLGAETIQDHAALDHPDEDVADRATEKVIEGQRPPGSEDPEAPRH